MSLKKIILRNFRTCHEVELSDLEHLTVLVGRNGVGKTNILQGVEWLARTASADRAIEAESLFGEFVLEGGTDFFGQAIFCLDDVDYRYTLEYLWFLKTGVALQESLERRDASGLWRRLLARKGERVFGSNEEQVAEIHEAVPMLAAMAKLMPTSKTKKDILPVLIYFRGIKYYSLDEVDALLVKEYTEVVPYFDYAKWLAQTRNSYDANDSLVMRILHMYLDRRDEFDELNKLLGVNGLGVLSLIIITPVKLGSAVVLPSDSEDDVAYYFVQFLPGNGWEGAKSLPKLAYDKLSYGTRRIIRILVSIFYDKNSLFLFEQPEDAIHPGLLRKLIGLLRTYSDKGQIMMASHATDLFDVLQPEEIRLVSMQGGATAVRALNATELAGARRFIDEEGSLSEFLNLLGDG